MTGFANKPKKHKFLLFAEEFKPFKKSAKSTILCTMPELLLAHLLLQPGLATTEDAVHALFDESGMPQRTTQPGVRKGRSTYNRAKDSAYQLQGKIEALLIDSGISAHPAVTLRDRVIQLNPAAVTSDFEDFLEIERALSSPDGFWNKLGLEGRPAIQAILGQMENWNLLPQWSFAWCEPIRQRIKEAEISLLTYLLELGDCGNEEYLEYLKKIYYYRRTENLLIDYINQLRKMGDYERIVFEITSYRIKSEEEISNSLQEALKEAQARISTDKSINPNRFYIEKITESDYEAIQKQAKALIDQTNEIAALEASEVATGDSYVGHLVLQIDQSRQLLEDEEDIPQRAEHLTGLARWLMTYWMLRGKWSAARTCASKLIELTACIPSTMDKVSLLIELGNMAGQGREFPEARNYLYQALGTSIELTDRRERLCAEAYVRSALANLYQHNKHPDIERARYHLEIARDILQEHGEEHEIVWVLLGLGQVYKDAGREEEAVATFERCIALKDLEQVNLRAIGYSYQILAEIYMNRGNLDEAYKILCGELILFERLGDNGGIGAVLDGFLNHAWVSQDLVRCAILLGAVRKWRGHFNIPGWNEWDAFAQKVESGISVLPGAILRGNLECFTHFPEQYSELKQFLLPRQS